MAYKISITNHAFDRGKHIVHLVEFVYAAYKKGVMLTNNQVNVERKMHGGYILVYMLKQDHVVLLTLYIYDPCVRWEDFHKRLIESSHVRNLVDKTPAGDWRKRRKEKARFKRKLYHGCGKKMNV